MKEKKKKIIILSIAIVAIIAIIAGSTYAYWQITRTQENPNDIVAACLDITMENETGTFGLDKAWPISDTEGESLTGYTFEVKNNCDENVNYIVGLNSVAGDSDNYLAYSSLRLKLDDKESSLISDFGDIGYSDPENTETVRDSKLLSMESLEGKGTTTHNVKVWIDENAPVTEQGKVFSGQIFITGGQGVPIYDDCFAIDTEGTIMGYDYSCGTSVSVPATIAGIDVKSISRASFALSNLEAYYLYNETTEEEKYVYYISDEKVVDDVLSLLKQEICEDPTTCTLEDIEAMGMIIITSKEEYDTIDWNSYTIEGPEVMYYNPETGEMEEASSRVTSLDLSKTVYLESIEESAFEENNDLETIIFPNDGKLKVIGDNAFYGSQLEEIVIPSSVNTIGNSAFGHHYSDKHYNEQKLLTSLTFENTADAPSQLINIGSNAFDYNNLTNVIIPFSVTKIGSNAFDGNELISVTFENTEPKESQLTNIGNNAFQNNKLTEVVIPSSVVSIGDSAFYNGVNKVPIAKLTIEDTLEKPSHLTNIGYQAFSGNSIDNIIIPDSVTTIGGNAFYNNGNVNTLVVGKNVNSIGSNALGSIQVQNATIKCSVNFSGAFTNDTTIKNVTIATSAKSLAGLNNLAIENLIFDGVSDSTSQLVTIAEDAFSNNKISSVVFPKSVTNISGFDNNSLTNVTIPKSVTTIGNKAFQNNSIATLTFEDSSNLENVGNYAFYCNKLTEITFPSKIKTLGDWSFAGKYTGLGTQCADGNKLASVKFEDTTTNPSQLTTIGSNVFVGNQLTKFVIPGTITSIGTSPFADNLNMTEIIIKKADNSNITFGTNWNRIDLLGTAATKFAKVTYNPNYTE